MKQKSKVFNLIMAFVLFIGMAGFFPKPAQAAAVSSSSVRSMAGAAIQALHTRMTLLNCSTRAARR